MQAPGIVFAVVFGVRWVESWEQVVWDAVQEWFGYEDWLLILFRGRHIFFLFDNLEMCKEVGMRPICGLS